MATVHIIGAGISGLAAATLLAEKRIPVKLYEASAHAGGRCRSERDARLGVLDHGIHLISARDTQLAQYLARIGSETLPLRVAPIPLPRAPLRDYLPLLGWLLRPRGRAEQALARDSALYDPWLRPLARVAFATLPGRLPARAMRHYLRRRRPRMMQRSLQASYVQPALDFIDQCGGSVYFNHALRKLERDAQGIRALVFARKRVALAPDDMVILAAPPAFVQTLLPELTLPVQEHRAITLHYPCAHREATDSIRYPTDAPMDMLRYHDGVIAAVIRVAEHRWHSGHDLLAADIWRAIGRLHPHLREIPMPAYAIWREKHAGHAVSEAPPVPHDHGRLLLAGDWIDPSRPPTLEAAAMHGHAAALLALQRMPKISRPSQQQFYLN